MRVVREPERKWPMIVVRFRTLWCFMVDRVIFYRNGTWHHWYKFFGRR